MPRKLLRRLLPAPHRVRSEKSLRVFGRLLANRQLWALNRRSVTRAASIGVFIAFLPFPGQMMLAGAAAIWMQFNLPVALIMVWVSNPITLPVIIYGAYRMGTWLLNTPPRELEFEMSFAWIASQLGDIWAPLMIGCLIAGFVAAAVTHTVVSVFWRIHVRRNWRARRRRASVAGSLRAAGQPVPSGASTVHPTASAGPSPAGHPPGSIRGPHAPQGPGRESP